MVTANIKLPKDYKKFFSSTEDITQLVEDEILVGDVIKLPPPLTCV